MKLSIEEVVRDGNDVVLRLLVFNDSTDVVEFDRRALIGPNGIPDGGHPLPVSLEPPAKKDALNTVLLNPYCLYGRERTFTVSGPVTFHAYLVKKPGPAGLLPDAPADKGNLAVSAEPLTVRPG